LLLQSEAAGLSNFLIEVSEPTELSEATVPSLLLVKKYPTLNAQPESSDDRLPLQKHQQFARFKYVPPWLSSKMGKPGTKIRDRDAFFALSFCPFGLFWENLNVY